MVTKYGMGSGLLLATALLGCSSGGDSTTEFSARNADGSTSLLHAHGLAASDDSTKLGRVCWYEARVFDKEFDIPMLASFTPEQSRVFLMSKSYVRPVTKYGIDCRLGIDKLKALLPGVDVSKICSLGSPAAQALSVADAPATFALQGAGTGCDSMCKVERPERYQPVFTAMGPECGAGASTAAGSSTRLTDDAFSPQFNFGFGDIFGGLMGVGSSLISSGTQKRCYKTHGDIAKTQGKANKDASKDYKSSYGNYTATSQNICNKCQDTQGDLVKSLSGMFAGLASASMFAPGSGLALQGNAETPVAGPSPTAGPTDSGQAASQFPEVDAQKFAQLKLEMAKMGANGPVGAKPCPDVPKAVLDVNTSSAARR